MKLWRQLFFSKYPASFKNAVGLSFMAFMLPVTVGIVSILKNCQNIFKNKICPTERTLDFNSTLISKVSPLDTPPFSMIVFFLIMLCFPDGIYQLLSYHIINIFIMFIVLTLQLNVRSKKTGISFFFSVYFKCQHIYMPSIQCMAHSRSLINIVEWITLHFKCEKSKACSKSQTLM